MKVAKKHLWNGFATPPPIQDCTFCCTKRKPLFEKKLTNQLLQNPPFLSFSILQYGDGKPVIYHSRETGLRPVLFNVPLALNNSVSFARLVNLSDPLIERLVKPSSKINVWLVFSVQTWLFAVWPDVVICHDFENFWKPLATIFVPQISFIIALMYIVQTILFDLR